MRLGDLDALAQKIEDKIKTYPLNNENAIGKISFEYCKMLIDNAPTVEHSLLPLASDIDSAYMRGYEVGKAEGILKANTRPQGEWIPVSERLPDKEGKYLVSTDYCDVCMDSYRDGWFVLNLGNVVAWQALPEPYKEGGEKNE